MLQKILYSTASKAPKFSWTTQKISTLKRLHHRGLSTHEIGKRMHRTQDSIQKALLRFGIRRKRMIKGCVRVCPLCKTKKYVPVNGNERKHRENGHAISIR